MFLLFGFKTVLRALFSRSGTCRNCGRFVPQNVQERATKLTVFFIPLLTVNRRYALVCTDCGYTTPLTVRQKNVLQK